MNAKIIAIVAVVVIVAGGAGAFMVLNNGNGAKNVERVDTALAVYGNANNDTVINNNDVTLIQEIIDGKKVLKDYPFADANNDSKVDSTDIDTVKNIIDKKATKVFISCLDPAGEATVKEVSYPVKNIAIIGTNMIPVAINSGSIPAIVGWYQSSTVYETVEKPLADAVESFGKAGRAALSDALWKKFTDKDAALISETGTGIQAFFVDHSLGKAISEKIRGDLATAGIPEIRLAVADPYEDISATMLLGFLVGGTTEETARNYANKSFDVLTTIKSKLSGLSDADKKTYIGITMSNYVCQNESTFGQIGTYVSGVPYYTVNDEFKTTYEGNGSTVMNSTEALSNYAIAAKLDGKRGIENIFSNRTIDFNVGTEQKNATIVSEWEKTCSGGAGGSTWDYFKDLDCKEHLWYINNLLPGACKLAYAAACLYPSIYTMEDANKVVADFAKFCPTMTGCTVENSTFCFGYADYVAAKS